MCEHSICSTITLLHSFPTCSPPSTNTNPSNPQIEPAPLSCSPVL
jgi:hypothetical protein